MDGPTVGELAALRLVSAEPRRPLAPKPRRGRAAEADPWEAARARSDARLQRRVAALRLEAERSWQRTLLAEAELLGRFERLLPAPAPSPARGRGRGPTGARSRGQGQAAAPPGRSAVPGAARQSRERLRRAPRGAGARGVEHRAGAAPPRHRATGRPVAAATGHAGPSALPRRRSRRRRVLRAQRARGFLPGLLAGLICGLAVAAGAYLLGFLSPVLGMPLR